MSAASFRPFSPSGSRLPGRSTPTSRRRSGAVSPAPDNSRRVLIVGATSAIAAEAAKAFAVSRARLFLTGRDSARLAAVADDLRVRGAAQVETAFLDVTDVARQSAVIDQAVAHWGGIDIALISHGALPAQARCQASVAETLRALDINFSGTVALLTILANYFEGRREDALPSSPRLPATGADRATTCMELPRVACTSCCSRVLDGSDGRCITRSRGSARSSTCPGSGDPLCSP